MKLNISICCGTIPSSLKYQKAYECVQQRQKKTHCEGAKEAVYSANAFQGATVYGTE